MKPIGESRTNVQSRFCELYKGKLTSWYIKCWNSWLERPSRNPEDGKPVKFIQTKVVFKNLERGLSTFRGDVEQSPRSI